ncbi:MAG: hypothetical protein AAF934_09340 [Bacteroidota bacterium]
MKSIKYLITNKTQPTNPKSKDPVTVLEIFFGTLLMILSGLILYLDKILNYFNLTINYEFKYYYDFESAVWHLTQTLSPLLIIASLFFKPKKWAYASPIAAFSIQLMFVLRDEHFIERDYFWAYTIAFIIFFFTMVFSIRRMIRLISGNVRKLKNMIKYLLHLIVVDIRKKHIPNEKEENYVKDIVFPTLRKLDHE